MYLQKMGAGFCSATDAGIHSFIDSLIHSAREQESPLLMANFLEEFMRGIS